LAWFDPQFKDLERFPFVLRTSWVWAGSTNPQAPKERRCAAGENTDDLHPVNPPLWAACLRF